MTFPDIFISRSRTGQSSTDDDLMREVRKGNAAAFRLLYDRYKEQVFIYCLRMINDRDATKDILQEVFVRVHSMAQAYKPDTNFNGWIHAIARNLCLNHCRSTRDHISYDETQEYACDVTNDKDRDVALQQILAQELERMPAIYREALILREYEDCSYAQIGQALGITLQTVRFRIFRAREILRERLGSRLDEYQ